MSKDVVALHGPDHCPGGPDPIPCLGGAYAWVSSQLNQTAALAPDDLRGFDISPVTDGFSSDPAILEPVDTGIQGIMLKQPGFVIATAVVIGWDDYTGTGTNVLDAVKGCGPVFDLSDISGKTYAVSNFASSVSGGNNQGDAATALTDSAIMPTPNRRISMSMIHSATVNAAFTQLDLYVYWAKAYPGSGETYTFP